MKTSTFSYRSELFSTSLVGQYRLHLDYSESNLRIGVKADSKLLVAEHFTLDTTQPEEIEALLKEHDILQCNFWEAVVLTVTNGLFTHLPDSLFKKEYATQALVLASGQLLEGLGVMHTIHPNYEAVTIFAAETALTEIFREAYPFENFSVLHQTDALLAYLTQAPTALLYIEENTGTLLLHQNGKLLFCNQFGFKDPNDLLYFVLLTFQEHKLSPANIPLQVLGKDLGVLGEYFECLETPTVAFPGFVSLL